MKNLLIVACWLSSLAGYGQPQQQPAIYDKMASELCTCVGRHHKGHLSEYSDSCAVAIIKKNAGAFRALGLDSLTDRDIGKIGFELGKVFRDKCPVVYSRIEEEIADSNHKADSIAKAHLLFFTGKVIAESFDGESKDYRITVQSATTNETKVFHFSMKLPELPGEFKIGYRIDTNKKTKAKTFVIVSIG